MGGGVNNTKKKKNKKNFLEFQLLTQKNKTKNEQKNERRKKNTILKVDPIMKGPFDVVLT